MRGAERTRRICVASIALAIFGAFAIPVRADEPTDPVTAQLLSTSRFVAVGVSPTTIFMSWFDASAIESKYRIESSPSESGPFTTVKEIAACGDFNRSCATTIDVPEADPTVRWYRVVALLRTGPSGGPFVELAGPPSNADPALAGPLQATGFGLSLVGQNAHLVWTNAAAADPKFKDNWVFRSLFNRSFGADPIARLSKTSTTYVDLGLPFETQFGYNVTAVRRVPIPLPSEPGHQEESFSPGVRGSVTTPQEPPPGAPTNLVGVFSLPDVVTLDFIDNATDEDGFFIQFGTPGTFEEQLAMGPRPGTGLVTFIHTGVPAESIRNYRVIAYRSGSPPKLSLPSNVVLVTTVPRAPVNLAATVVAANQVDLTWTDRSSIETGFRLERCSGGPCASPGDFIPLVVLPVNTQAYTDATTVGSTTYKYRVLAFNTSGGSAPSNIVTVTTPAPPFGPPPTGLTAIPIDAHHIKVDWTDNTPDETNFVLEFQDPGQPFITLVTLGANITTHLDGFNLPGMHTRCYRVRAFKAGTGMSDPSNTACATTPPGSPPNAPSGLTATPVFDLAGQGTIINLAWTDNSTDEDGFLLEHSTDGVSFTLLVRLASNTTSIQHGGLAPNSGHYYRVHAFNFDGTSGPSNTAFAITKGPTRPVFLQPSKSEQTDPRACDTHGTFTTGQGVFDMTITIFPKIPGKAAQVFTTTSSNGNPCGPGNPCVELNYAGAGTWRLQYHFFGDVHYHLLAKTQSPDGFSAGNMLFDYTVLADCTPTP